MPWNFGFPMVLPLVYMAWFTKMQTSRHGCAVQL